MHQGEVVPPIVLGHAEPGRSSYWAVLFLAIVSAVSVLIGIPIVGEIPGTLQIAGLALVTAGLLVTIGVLDRLRLALRRR